MKRRILIALLALEVSLSSMPMTAFAAENTEVPPSTEKVSKTSELEVTETVTVTPSQVTVDADEGLASQSSEGGIPVGGVERALRTLNDNPTETTNTTPGDSTDSGSDSSATPQKITVTSIGELQTKLADTANKNITFDVTEETNTVANQLTIGKEQNLTINFYGKTITSNAVAFVVNGILNLFGNGGKLTSSGNGAAIKVNNGATLDMSYITVTANNGTCIDVMNNAKDAEDTETKVYVYESTLTGKQGIVVNDSGNGFTIADDANRTISLSNYVGIENSKIDAKGGVGIIAGDNDCRVALMNSDVSGTTGVEVKGGVLELAVGNNITGTNGAAIHLKQDGSKRVELNAKGANLKGTDGVVKITQPDGYKPNDDSLLNEIYIFISGINPDPKLESDEEKNIRVQYATPTEILQIKTNESGEASESDLPSAPIVSAFKYANMPVSVGGSTVKTQITGSYFAETVQGMAAVSTKEEIRASLNLKEGQTPHVIIYDTDTKKSNKAMDSLNSAVGMTGGGKISTTLDVTLGAMDKGRFVTLADGKTRMMAGLPKNADKTKSFRVICVQPGGKITVMDDVIVDPVRGTILFDVLAGRGTYAIVEK